MNPLKAIKAVLIGVWVLGLTLFATSSSLSKVTVDPSTATDKSDAYVGSETCKTCHEDQFKEFSHTAHAGLESMAGWKDKVVG